MAKALIELLFDELRENVEHRRNYETRANVDTLEDSVLLTRYMGFVMAEYVPKGEAKRIEMLAKWFSDLDTAAQYKFLDMTANGETLPGDDEIIIVD